MKIVTLDHVKMEKVTMEGASGVWKQIPLGNKEGAPAFSYRVFTLEPGGNTPFHSHPYEHMNYIIEGEGVLVDASGNEHPLKTGDFAIVHPDEKHQYRNTSCERIFRMICGVPVKFE